MKGKDIGMGKTKMTLAPLACAACALAAGAAETPTMGWSSWNTYRVNISDALIMKQADAMVALGLDKCGYRYVNIDDGYFGGRDESGRLKTHPKRFPNGLKGVVDHIHGLGLKAGIYSDGGENTCGSYWDKDELGIGVGMWKHDQQDADYFFKELGFDFIKIDFCGGMAYGNSMKKDMDCRERYTAIRKAVDAARPGVRINVCRWDYPGTWVREIGSSWRMSRDIRATWGSVKAIIEENLYLSAYAAPGAYNDMDMLEVGRGLTEEEDRTHFAVWCMMSSPLLIGCDLESLREKPKTLALLKNPDLIALDQDTAAPQAYVAKKDGDAYVLVRDIEKPFGTKRAIAFVNLGDKPCEMSISAKEIDLAGINRARCITASSGASAEWFPLEDGRRISAGGAVPAHGTRVYLVETAKRLERELYEAETAFMPTYQELSDPKKAKTAYYAKDEKASGGMYAAGLGGRKGNDLVWEKVWSKDGGTYQMLVKTVGEGGAVKAKANGAECARAKTTGGMEAFCAFRVALRPGVNEIRLYNDEEPLPGIDAMWLAGDDGEGGAGDVR